MLDVVLNTLLHEGEGRGMRATMPDLNALIKIGEGVEENNKYSLSGNERVKGVDSTNSCS